MDLRRIKDFLDRRADQYENISFIERDPISVPHRFSKKQDREIMGFFAATLAWGQRTTIIRNSLKLAEWMDEAPHDFIKNHQEKERNRFLGFVHRTFNDTDLLYFIEFLQQHYQEEESLETAFFPGHRTVPVQKALSGFHDRFFSLPDAPERTRKHVSTPAKKSACKRLNMYLRWMVRPATKGVDFGIWKSISAAELVCPLDTHVHRVAGELGLLRRKQADWQAALELTAFLKELDPLDPVRYDYALFSLGAEEGF